MVGAVKKVNVIREKIGAVRGPIEIEQTGGLLWEVTFKLSPDKGPRWERAWCDQGTKKERHSGRVRGWDQTKMLRLAGARLRCEKITLTLFSRTQLYSDHGHLPP